MVIHADWKIPKPPDHCVWLVLEKKQFREGDDKAVPSAIRTLPAVRFILRCLHHRRKGALSCPWLRLMCPTSRQQIRCFATCIASCSGALDLAATIGGPHCCKGSSHNSAAKPLQHHDPPSLTPIILLFLSLLVVLSFPEGLRDSCRVGP